jgi:hypothetical protein
VLEFECLSTLLNPQVHKNLAYGNCMHKENVEEADLNSQEQKIVRFTKIS